MLETIARQAAADALVLCGPPLDGGGYIRTAPLETYLTGQRLVLAREALAVAGKDRHTINVDTLTERFLPRLRELVQSGKVV
jgi:hypothetical protein